MITQEEEIKAAILLHRFLHDIRSPLAALSMVEKNLDSLSPEIRTILKNSVSEIRRMVNSLAEMKPIFSKEKLKELMNR